MGRVRVSCIDFNYLYPCARFVLHSWVRTVVRSINDDWRTAACVNEREQLEKRRAARGCHWSHIHRVYLRVQITPKSFPFSIISSIHRAHAWTNELCTKAKAESPHRKIRINFEIWLLERISIITILIHNKMILAFCWSREHNTQRSLCTLGCHLRYTHNVFVLCSLSFHFIVTKGPCISLIALASTWFGNENVKHNTHRHTHTEKRRRRKVKRKILSLLSKYSSNQHQNKTPPTPASATN